MENENYIERNSNKIAFIAILILIIGILVLPWALSQHHWKFSFKNTGQIGDTIGGITAPLIGLISAILIYLAFKVQIRANLEIQKQFKIQQFEDKFYSMLEFHRDNINNMSIQFSDIIEFEYVKDSLQPRKKSSTPKSRRDVEIRGMDIINGMITEFELALELIEQVFLPKNKKQEEENNRIAFLLFFHGFESKIFRKYTSDKYNSIKGSITHYRRVFERRHSGDFIKEYWVHTIKFPPFHGHESRLPHYFRNLFQTLNLVKDSTDKIPLSKNSIMDYVRMLRSQLSNSEQYLVYINYRYGYGKSWDKTLDKNSNNQFLTLYKMIHNIQIDNISRQIENPQIHFSNYIKSFCTEEDPLFEWGDS